MGCLLYTTTLPLNQYQARDLLWDGIEEADLVKVQQALSNNALQKHDYYEKVTALLKAMYVNYQPIILELIQFGVDVNEALARAAENGPLCVVQRLLSNYGADLHAWNDNALRKAAENCQLHIVKFLIQYGAYVHALDDAALKVAATNKYWDVVACLLHHGADRTKLTAEQEEQMRNSAQAQEYIAYELHEAFNNLDFSTVEQLLSIIPMEKIPPFFQELIWDFSDGKILVMEQQNTLLLQAAKQGDLSGMRQAIARGANIHCKYEQSLRNATKSLSAVKFLLQQGADIHAWDDRALDIAIDDGDLPLLRLLLGYGADVHIYNACPYKLDNIENASIIACLLQHGVARTKFSKEQLEKMYTSAEARQYIASEISIALQYRNSQALEELLHIIPCDCLPQKTQSQIYQFVLQRELHSAHRPVAQHSLAAGTVIHAQNGVLRWAAAHRLWAAVASVLQHGGDRNKLTPQEMEAMRNSSQVQEYIKGEIRSALSNLDFLAVETLLGIMPFDKLPQYLQEDISEIF